MSHFENYSITSKNYDETRIPVGLDQILKFAKDLGKPLHELDLLDCGCGSGNYIYQLSKYFGSVTGIDANSGMLEQAKKKMKDLSNVKIHQGLVTSLPMKENSYDIVITTQVIHHLDDEKNYSTRENATKMFKEVQRVLKPNGRFIINTTFPKQYELGYWYSDFIPNTIKIFNEKLPSQKQFEEMIETSQLNLISMNKLEDSLMIGYDYLNPKGPLNKEWRDGDSGFSVLSDEQIDQMILQIQMMIDDNTIIEFLKKKEELRKKHGQSTFIICKK
eukprot:gene8340-164_t